MTHNDSHHLDAPKMYLAPGAFFLRSAVKAVAFASAHFPQIMGTYSAFCGDVPVVCESEKIYINHHTQPPSYPQKNTKNKHVRIIDIIGVPLHCLKPFRSWPQSYHPIRSSIAVSKLVPATVECHYSVIFIDK